MSNRVNIQIISMTYYNEELMPCSTGWGYYIADDYSHNWVDLWDSGEEFLKEIKEYDEDPAKAIVMYIYHEGSINDRDCIVTAVDLNLGFDIFNEYYEGKEVGKWLGIDIREGKNNE